MGLQLSTRPSRPQSHIHFQDENWLALQNHIHNVTQMGSFVTLKNKITSQVLRAYTVQFHSRKQADIYVEEFDEWRVVARWNVLESRYLVCDFDQFGIAGMCSSYFHVKIFVENPLLTLAGINDIPPPQSLYILLSALVGFQHLFDLFGYFPLSENMIMINQLGLLKVWINPDLSQNRPNYIHFNQISAQHMQNPTRFILQLIDLIDNNTDYKQLHTSFRQYMHVKHYPKSVLTFGNCRKLLLNFAQQNQLDIPDSLMQIVDLLFQKTNRSDISHQNHLVHMDQAYMAGQQENQDFQPDPQEYDQFTCEKHSNPNDYKHQSHNEMIQSFQQYPHITQQISRQVNNIVQRTKSHHNQSLSQSSNNVSSRQTSYNTLDGAKNIVGYQSQSQSPLSHHEIHGHNHQLSHGVIYTNAYQMQQERLANLPIINLTQNNNLIAYERNPYQSLLQRQADDRQSTIREEAEEDSFFTSRHNSKFQTSRDLRRTSNQLKKAYKNMQTHRQTFSSHSESKLNIQNYSPRQVQVKEQSQIQGNSNLQIATKRSGRCIQFYTPNEMKEIDAEIAQDLQCLMESLKETKLSG